MAGQNVGKKKGGFFRNRLRYLRIVRGTWPPESPAKLYLKVSYLSASALIYNIVAQRRRLDGSEVLKNTA